MAIDIYLSVNNNEEVIRLPVIPPEISITSSQGTETFETSGYGFIRIIGSRELTGISWSSFFPVHDYPFLRDTSMQGQEYADKINLWRDRKLPIRLVITSTGFANLDVNIACTISSLDGNVGPNGDYNYSIQIDEVDLLSTALNGEEELTMAQFEELIARLEALEERIKNMEDAKVYNFADDVPSWAKTAINKIVKKGYINGTGDNELGLTTDMMRMCVILDNAGVFD